MSKGSLWSVEYNSGKLLFFSMLPPYITLDIDKDILQVKEILRSLQKQDLKNLFRELGLYDHTVRNKDSEFLEVYAEDLVRAWICGKDNVVNSYQGAATWENLKKALVKINYVGVARSI